MPPLVVSPSPRAAAAALICAGAVLLGACVGRGSPPTDARPTPTDSSPGASSETDPSDGSVSAATVVEAAERTLATPTGRFTVDIEIGATQGAGARLLRTSVTGAVDRPREAYAASLDLSAVAASVPEAVDGLGPGMVGDVLEVRVVGSDAWVRNGSAAPWRASPGGAVPLSALTGTAGPDELLALLAAADGPAVPLDGGRYTGHIGAAAVARVDGRPAQLDALGAGLPPEVAERLLRYEVELDGDGLVRRLLVEVDLASIAAGLGEPAPEGVVFRWVLTLDELGAAVDIRPPG